jgi:hypothetical protein
MFLIAGWALRTARQGATLASRSRVKPVLFLYVSFYLSWRCCSVCFFDIVLILLNKINWHDCCLNKGRETTTADQ